MDALVNHHEMVSIRGRDFTNLRYDNNIERLTCNKEELAHLVQCIDKTSRVYEMEINAEKTKMMANVYGRTSPEIMVNGCILQTVKEYKYLGFIVLDESSKPEVLARTAQALSAIAGLKLIWAQ